MAGTPEECAARMGRLLRTGIDGCSLPLLGVARRERPGVLRDLVLPAAAR